MKLYPINVGDLVASKPNKDYVGVVENISPHQAIFWIRWMDMDKKVLYSMKDFDTMFYVVERA